MSTVARRDLSAQPAQFDGSDIDPRDPPVGESQPSSATRGFVGQDFQDLVTLCGYLVISVLLLVVKAVKLGR